MSIEFPRYGSNWIAGAEHAPISSNTQDVINPADGTVLGKVAMSGEADVSLAIVEGQKAFQKWKRWTVKERMKPLLRFRQLIEQHEEQFVQLVVEENGKNRNEARGSVRKGNETVEYACGMPQLLAGKCLEVSNGVECKELRMPLGVVASVVPFNFPIMVPLWTIPIAMATGNCIILKPSEKVPSCGMLLAKLSKLAGFPDGVFQVVNGGKDVVNALCDNPDLNGLTFVGSTKVAKLVYKRCANQEIPKKCLALGGAKNHMIAMADCDIKMCSHDIVNSFAGTAGQRCMAAANLVLVGENDDLLNAIVEEAKSRSFGFEKMQIGPVIDQAAHTRITRYITDAEKAGAKILLDGRKVNKTKGTWVGPTIILVPDTSLGCFNDEIFGPVLSALIVNSREEAIAVENSNRYGNAACIYTSSGDHAEWFSKRFSAGMIGVNIGVPVPREPFAFGGINESKFGNSDITADGGIEFFTQRKKITTKWRPSVKKTWMD